MSTYALIPGAGGSAWYWHLVAAELGARDHDVIAVDLPADDDSAGLARYADTVVEAMGERADPVLVAQSMGAYTATIVCERIPVRLLILVNPMIPTPGESAGAWWETTGQSAAMQEHAKRIGLEGLSMNDFENLFGHDVPPDVWAESANHLRDQSGTPFGETWPLDAWPDVPTRVLVSRDDRLFPIEFQRRVMRERLGFAPDEMDGGHLVAFSRPAELAARLDAYGRTDS
ncbi:MAG: alpha/beta fold hydrolase [Thermoleophilaceae bacterium]